LGLRIISTGGLLGLFGEVGYSGAIENVRLKNTSVVTNPTMSNVGTLVGHNHGLVMRCGSDGTLSGCDSLGGLIGDNEGTLQACCFAGSVNGRDAVGGLVGWNSGVIVDCYCVGSVAGHSMVGGLLPVKRPTTGTRQSLWMESSP
jgi:hypothetical protein